jgi:hypothetical protein
MCTGMGARDDTPFRGAFTARDATGGFEGRKRFISSSRRVGMKAIW